MSLAIQDAVKSTYFHIFYLYHLTEFIMYRIIWDKRYS